jgi:hypothetical protein
MLTLPGMGKRMTARNRAGAEGKYSRRYGVIILTSLKVIRVSVAIKLIPIVTEELPRLSNISNRLDSMKKQIHTYQQSIYSAWILSY